MRLRTAAIAFAVGFVLSTVVLLLVIPADPGRTLPMLALSLALALITASFAGSVRTFRSIGMLRRIADPDPVSQRAIARAVTRNDDSHLDDEQRRRSAHFAAAVASYQPTLFSQTLLVLVAVVVLQFSGPNGFADDLVVVRIVLIGGVALAILVLAPIAVRQIRSVRRYSRKHPIDATAGFEPAK